MCIKRLQFVVIGLLFSLCSFAGKQPVGNWNTIPLAQSIEPLKEINFVLNGKTTIYCPDNANELQKRNVEFLISYIEEVTGMKLKENSKMANNQIRLSLNSSIKGNEAYEIKSTPKVLMLSGSTPAGVFYGLQTLTKALPIAKNVKQVELPSVLISDSPRFVYRAFLIDVGRHFFSIEYLKKLIDMFALHHINYFHWHLTEDQGWRIEIKKYPKLTEIGSKRSGTVVGHNSDVDDNIPYGGYYTQEDAKEIVRYAQQRHITVIPEIDLPGHTRALLAAYPEMGCTQGPYEVGHNWGIYEDVLCLGNEKIYPFLQDIIDELIPIFPAPYFHIGGDEAPTTRWQNCDRCKALAQKQGVSPKHLQGGFTNRLEKYINSKGKKIIGWDEILEGDINPSATIMSWTGVTPGVKAAKAGHDVIFSPGEYAYIDHYQTKEIHKEPKAIGGYLPVEKVYSFNPLPDTLSVEARKHIIGVQANLWTEYVPYETQAEYMLLPRVAALAEVQWLPVNKKDYDAFHKRLTRLARLYDRYGYTYALHAWPERYNHQRSVW